MSSKGQVYSNMEPEYRYDEKTDSLVVCGQKDMQALADSNKDCALNVILSKFSNDEINQYMSEQSALFSDDLDCIDSEGLYDRVDALNDLSAHLYEIKDKYGLGSDSLDDLVAEIESKKAELNRKIKAFKSEVKDESKEVVQEGKQEELSLGEKSS